MRKWVAVVGIVLAAGLPGSAGAVSVDSFYVSSSQFFRVVLSGLEPGMQARCAVQDADGKNVGVSSWMRMEPPVDEITVRVPNARSISGATVQCWTRRN